MIIQDSYEGNLSCNADRFVCAKAMLEELYSNYHKREFVHPDPLEFLYYYRDIRDREIVGLVASSLAYGKVSHILKSISFVLERIKSPAVWVRRTSPSQLRRMFYGFRHRFTTGDDLCLMFGGIKRVVEGYGSLSACFLSGLSDEHETILPALSAFVEELTIESGQRSNLFPSPERGSACKRLNLFLRWMVREDDVDPGGWGEIPTSKLVVPLDTHMHRLGLAMGFTTRKQADMRTALEITSTLRMISPSDPVRYDFSLTRVGIRKEYQLERLLNRHVLNRSDTAP